jgi:hypothetical protein
MPTPDGSYVIPHQKCDSTTYHTYYVISVDDECAYAMLATLEGPIRTELRTLINTRGNNHSKISNIQINPHTRNILGRTYRQLYITPGTQELAPNIKLPICNHVNGITCRRADTSAGPPSYCIMSTT